MARAPRTLIEHVYVRNRSLRETSITMTFIVQWAFAMQQLRVDSLTMPEYVTYWQKEESKSKAYRRWDSFRRTFPDHVDPNVIARELASMMDEKLSEKKFAADVPLQKIDAAVFA